MWIVVIWKSSSWKQYILSFIPPFSFYRLLKILEKGIPQLSPSALLDGLKSLLNLGIDSNSYLIQVWQNFNGNTFLSVVVIVLWLVYFNVFCSVYHYALRSCLLLSCFYIFYAVYFVVLLNSISIRMLRLYEYKVDMIAISSFLTAFHQKVITVKLSGASIHSYYMLFCYVPIVSLFFYELCFNMILGSWTSYSGFLLLVFSVNH